MKRASRGGIVAPAGATLAAALRTALPGRSWSEVRALCASGKVFVDGERALDPTQRLRGAEKISWDLNRPDPRRGANHPGFRIVHEDPHLVVIEKPEGVMTAPYEGKETGTAMDLIRRDWRAQGRRATAAALYVVHRLDKETSGLLCFAKTKAAERGLHRIFKQHLGERSYVAVAHGKVTSGRIQSRLVADRGDGIRGSSPRGGQEAVTWVEAVEHLTAATVCRVRLETGRTHQIRIHLAEQGHPLVGEVVYIRDFVRSGSVPLRSGRLLLHAATLGFDHPMTGERLQLESAPPASFSAELERLRPSAK